MHRIPGCPEEKIEADVVEGQKECEIPEPDERGKLRLERERRCTKRVINNLRHEEQLQAQGDVGYLMEDLFQRVFHQPRKELKRHEDRAQEHADRRKEADEALRRKLESLAKLKMILSDPRRAVAVKKRRQISRYAEIVQRLLQERKKMERLKRGPKLVTKKTKSLVLKVEPTTTLPVEAMDHLETILEDECEMETEEEIKAEDLAAEEKEVTKIQKEKKGKKGAKKDKGKKAKEKKTTKKEKKKGEANKAKKKDKKGGKRKEGKVGKKGKKGKKSEGKGKKGKKKEEEGVVYVPPLEPLRRKIVLPEDILEPFQVEMQVPPPSPLPPDPYIEVKPEPIFFKDFVCGRRYTKILHIRNIGPRSLKCRLHVVDQSGEGLITVLEADTANTRPILTGLSFTLRVSFEPVQDIQSEIAIIVLRTRRTGSPERELGIRVRCDPCQPEPIINPTEISIPAGSRWGSVLIENKGSKSCIFSIQNLPLVEYDDLLEEILDNVFREFQFMKKYNIEIGPQKSARIRVKFCPHGDPGPREEKFLFRFQECPPQEVTLRGTVTPNPLIVTPQWLELGLCLTDTHVLQKSFNITNISRSPVKVAVQASRVTVIPSHAFIYAGDTLRVSVRLVTKRLGNVKLPVVVHAGEHSVEVIVHCKSCKRQALTLIPKQINLGNVTVAETVTYPFRVKNKTAAVVGYGFLNLPPEVSIQPGDSFGTILPFGEISLQLLYSPTFQENASRTSSNKSSQNLESTSESSQAEMSYTLNTMESISSIENSPDISQTSQIPQVSSKVFHQSTESQSMLKVTSPEFPSTSTTEVSLTDQEILAKVPSIPGTSHRSFRLYCYADTGSKAEAYCTAQVVRLQCYMLPSSIYFPPTPCGSYNVIRTKLHALEDIRYEIKSSHESLHVAPRSGHLNTGAIVTIFLVFRPLQEDIPEHLLITCTTEFSWFQVPVFCKVVTPDYILIDDSPRIEFGPVVIGTRITTELLLLNMRSYSIKMLSTLLNPLGPFWSPVQYTNVESGHLLALPISFRPENLDTVFNEFLEVWGEGTVLPLMVSGYGVEAKYTFHPDIIVHRFEGSSATLNLEIRNMCAAALPVRTTLVFVRQGPAPKKKKSKGAKKKSKEEKKKNKKGKKKDKKQNKEAEATPSPDLEEELQQIPLAAESAFNIQPPTLTIQANQKGVFKVQYEALAANSIHVARFHFALGFLYPLRDITFLGTSGILKKKKDKKEKGKNKKDKSKKGKDKQSKGKKDKPKGKKKK